MSRTFDEAQGCGTFFFHKGLISYSFFLVKRIIALLPSVLARYAS